VIAVQEFEAWLLADDRALGDYLDSNVQAIQAPESVDSPKERLQKLFDSKGRNLIEFDDYVELAKSVDIEVVARKCPSFERLRTYVSGI